MYNTAHLKSTNHAKFAISPNPLSLIGLPLYGPFAVFSFQLGKVVKNEQLLHEATKILPAKDNN